MAYHQSLYVVIFVLWMLSSDIIIGSLTEEKIQKNKVDLYRENIHNGSRKIRANAMHLVRNTNMVNVNRLRLKRELGKYGFTGATRGARGISRSPHGTITSENYPNNYRESSEMIDIVQLDELRNFIITISNFSLEKPNKKGECYDKFILYKEDTIVVGPICGTLNNNTDTNTCDLSNNELTCSFMSKKFHSTLISDELIESTGYILSYTSTSATSSQICDSLLVMVEKSATNERFRLSTSLGFNDRLLSYEYLRGINCNWMIPQAIPANYTVDRLKIDIQYISLFNICITSINPIVCTMDKFQIRKVVTGNKNSMLDLAHSILTATDIQALSLRYTDIESLDPITIPLYDVEHGIQVTFDSNKKSYEVAYINVEFIVKYTQKKTSKHDINVTSSIRHISIQDVLTNTLICQREAGCYYIITFKADFGSEIYLQVIKLNSMISIWDGPDRGYEVLFKQHQSTFKYENFMSDWYDIDPEIIYVSGGPYLTVSLDSDANYSSHSKMRYASRSIFLPTGYRLRRCKVSGTGMGVLSRNRVTTFRITRGKFKNRRNYYCYAAFVIPKGLIVHVNIAIDTVNDDCVSRGVALSYNDKDIQVCHSNSTILISSSYLKMVMYLYARDGEERNARLYVRIHTIYPADIHSPKLIDSCTQIKDEENNADEQSNSIHDIMGFIAFKNYPEKSKQRLSYNKKQGPCHVILSLNTHALADPQYIQLYIHKYYGFLFKIIEKLDREHKKEIVQILMAGGKTLLLTHVTLRSISTEELVLELSNSIAKIEYQTRSYTDLPIITDYNYQIRKSGTNSFNVKTDYEYLNSTNFEQLNGTANVITDQDKLKYTAYFNNNSYTLNNMPNLRDATLAEEFCIGQGGHLFSASTIPELETIKSVLATRWMDKLLNASQSYIFWADILIGLQKKDGQAEWRWSDGSPLTITDWYYPDILNHYIPKDIQNQACLSLFRQRQDTFMIQPVDDRGYNCTMMGIHNPRQSTNWHTVDCEHIPEYVNLFICEIPDDGLKLDNIPSLLQNNKRKSRSATYKYEQFDRSLTCPSNWTYIHGRCWLVLHADVSHQVEQNMTGHGHYHTITDAQGGCKIYGGYMVNITDLEIAKKYLTYTKHREEYGNIWVLSNGTLACIQYRPKRDLSDIETDRLEIQTNEGKQCVSNWIIEQHVKHFKPKKRRKFSEINKNYFPFHCNYESKPINGSNIEVYNATCYPNHVFCARDVVPIPKSCQTGYIQCEDDSCISPDLLCNHINDCPSGKDELSCDLDDYLYKCTNNETITISKYCDYVKDCRDGSDEKGCVYPPCSHEQFQCDNKQCVDKTRRCNGLKDGCIDESDESSCSRGHCTNGFFCSEGCIRTCISEKRKNDGMSDCRYGVDEPYMSKYSKNYHLKAVKQNCSAEEGRCAVRNEGCFNRGDACVLGYDSDGRMTGCRDGTHLTDCSTFECPGRYKCLNSYCIDLKRVCNGIRDCQFGEDEAECHDTHSPGMYRCGENQTHSVGSSQVCNQEFDCAHYHSDEKYCSLPECPKGCTCRGFYYNCEGNITQNISISNANFSNLARTLNLARNYLGNITANLHFSDFPFLAFLRLAHSHIAEIDNTTFRTLHNLLTLDLRYNSLRSLSQGAFQDLGRLKNLLLKGNHIQTMLSRTFIGMSQLSFLNLSCLKIATMNTGALRGLTNLKILDLSGNTNTHIHVGVFNKSQKLHKVILTNNDLSKTIHIKEVIGDITSRVIEADTFRFCCFRDPKRTTNCTPNVDIYSSCGDLMSNSFLQIAIWLIGCLAFVGNITVIICRVIIGIKSPAEICIFALSCSDLMTGVYLVILASVDTRYRSKYIEHDLEWKGSTLCQLCGILSTLSSQLSSFLLLLITLDRFIHLVFPMKGIRYSRRSTVITCVVLFLISLLSSLIPILVPSYFGDAYYSKTALCLAYDFTSRSKGWEYTVGMFISVNLFNCILTLVCYSAIFCSVSRSSKRSDPERKSDIALAKTLFLLVLTDLICWFPLIIASLDVINGGKVRGEMAAMLAVVVLPINAALNPYLYTISSVQNARSRRRTERHDRKLLGQGSHATGPTTQSNTTTRKSCPTAATYDSRTAEATSDSRKPVKQHTTIPVVQENRSTKKTRKVSSIEVTPDSYDDVATTDTTSTHRKSYRSLSVFYDSPTHDTDPREIHHPDDEDESCTVVLIHPEPTSSQPSTNL